MAIVQACPRCRDGGDPKPYIMQDGTERMKCYDCGHIYHG